MIFERTPLRRLPNGRLATVYPFHVCTEGLEDRVILRSEEDMRVAHNYVPLCSRRCNVIPVADCLMHTHIHSMLLAASFEDARKFTLRYNISLSKYLTNRYGDGHPLKICRNIVSRPIYLEDNRYVRNVICYIHRNPLDLGVNIQEYKWSSFSAIFPDKGSDSRTSPVKKMTYRDVRSVLRVDSADIDSKWMITDDGIIAPSSYCDVEYAESAFGHDRKFYLRVLGFTDDEQLRQELVVNPNVRHKLDEIMLLINEKSKKAYQCRPEELTYSQKIPLIKSTFYSWKVSPAQLARCFGLKSKDIRSILNLPPDSQI